MELAGEDLTCVRAGRRIFAGLEFALGPGDALVLVGPNGSGKSSLLRLIAGLVPLAGGRLVCDGADIADDPGAFRLRLHYAGHLDAIKSALTTAENLQTWAALFGVPSAERATRVAMALAAFDLDMLAATPAAYLSAGQRRRLSLARLQVDRRPLWLLDEPTVALDACAVERLGAVIADHRAAGGLVIAATHLDLPIGRSARLDVDCFAAAPDPDMVGVA